MPRNSNSYFAKLLLLFVTLTSVANAAETEKSKLVAVIVIDQFRSDYLSRFQNRFLPAQLKNGKLGGFNYLMKNGAYFP
nr:hypothetical protein [Bacteriovoracaceae bacterium]